MSIAGNLVKKGITFAYFKFGKNAEEFARLWTQNGLICEIEIANRDSRGIIDPPADVDNPEDPYRKRAYLCACFTKAEVKQYKEAERRIRMAETQPEKYWRMRVREGVMKHIDPEIRQLIKELNEQGLYTMESCAGHGKSDPGTILFLQKNPDCNKIRRILLKHGLTGLKKDSQPSDSQKVVYEFDPIGKRRKGL